MIKNSNVLIVGELINTSRKLVKEAVENRNDSYIRLLAKAQEAAGAAYIDVNCGNMVKNECEIMAWLVKCIQEEVNIPLCIDSPSAEALETGLSIAKNGRPMINSISAEKERYESVLPLIQKYNAKAVVLCMDSKGMPDTSEDRMTVVRELYPRLINAGIAPEDLYFDPLVKPISSVTSAGAEVLETIRQIRQEFPAVHFMCGLSNISFGLPNRYLLNRLFVVETMTLGMDGYVLDPTNNKMMGTIAAATALLGKDKYCKGYIKAHRKGLLEE